MNSSLERARYSAFFDLRVHLVDARSDAYFDLTQIGADSAEEAIGYAVRLATDCFGISHERLRVHVLNAQPIIDC